MQHNANLQVSREPKLPSIYNFGLYSLFIYIVTSIFYIFPSGNPQPANILIAGTILVFGLYIFTREKIGITPIALITLSFGLFTLVINLIHYVFLPDMTFFKSSLYYIYNGCFMLLVIWLFKMAPDRTARVIYIALVLSFIMEVLFIGILGNMRGDRNIGTFFNPNQLSQWALVMCCVLLLIKSRSKLNLLDYFIFLGLGYVIALSLSKAGLVCYILLAGTLILSKSVSTNARIVLIGMALLSGVFILNSPQYLSKVAEKSIVLDSSLREINQIGKEEDESLQGRHYTRIFNNPEYILMGAGEGGFARFEDSPKNLEIHSGLGTVLFSYGICGFLLFCGILYYVTKNNYWYVAFLVFVLMLFGLVHQNVRSTHFWLFLGVAYSIRMVSSQEKKFNLPARRIVIAPHKQTLPSNYQSPKPVK